MEYCSICLIVIILFLLIWRSMVLIKKRESFQQDWFYSKNGPTRPIILSAEGLEAGCRVTWKRPTTAPDAPISRYSILLRHDDNNLADLFMNFTNNTDCEECEYIFENLDEDTGYSVSVIASNQYGHSEPAIPKSIRTLRVVKNEPTPTPIPTTLPVEPTIPPDNVQPEFWEDKAKKLEGAKKEINKDQYDHLIESAQGVLEPKDQFPDYFPDDYLKGLEGESQKLSDLIKQSLYAGEAIVRVNN